MAVTPRENRVVLYNYSSFKKEHIEFDTAPFYFQPVFRIGEIAKFLQRSPDTIRKYEGLGYLPKPQTFSMNRAGSRKLRLYTEEHLMDIADFFSQRNPPGRQSKTNSKIDRKHLLDNIKARFEEYR